MDRFEYKVMKLDIKTKLLGQEFDSAKFEEELNLLGGEGWELIGTTDLVTNGYTMSIVGTLKRKI